MTIIIGGHALGLQDGSLGLLNRNDATGKGALGSGVESYLDVANGNLLIQERDVFLPSLGIDFALTRTYNSRGAIQGSSDGWWWSSGITLSTHQDKPASNDSSVTSYLVTYGDGTSLHFDFDASRNLWVSTDGAGAYETLQDLGGGPQGAVKYVVTRADQTKYNFDKDFVLLSIVDTNGVTTSFTYQGGRIQTVADDTGHLIVYQYDGIGKLASIVDRHNGTDVTLVRYVYASSQLSQVIDRFGHATSFTYNNNGLLTKVSLPTTQVVNGQTQTFEAREISFTYQQVAWSDNPHLTTPFDSGSQWIVTSITDALGGVTSFDYSFQFNTDAVAPGDRDLHYKQLGGRYFAGGTTRVVDAMGNGLATSDGADFQAKRVALGFAALVANLTQAQRDALRQQFSVTYSYDPDGYITRVVDQQGLATTYTYGGKTTADPQTAVNQDNLLSITDRNGAGATTSDSAYFRSLRADLGFVDAAGNGKLVAALTAAEITQLLDRFTSRFTYDARGNLLTSTDAAGNQQSYTYTAFNKVAGATSAMGNALATSDAAVIQAKRVELGFAATVAGLSAANKAALQALYTTTYAYDARQNLVTRTDAGGDVTTFEYDANGNLTKRTVVYRDAANAAVPAKNQVTTYAYDAFGNNTSIVDGEGATTLRTFDHFGNLLTSRDGRGNVTTHTYDADNRLLTTTDAEGHVTVNTYDAVGNRISTTDAAGKTITQVFDRNNLLIATIDPSLAGPAFTRTTNFKYDILGNRTEVTDAEGRKTVYAYDARRQLVDVRTPQVLKADGTLTSYATTYAYDGESRIVTLTDNNGSVTQSLYTTNGLLKRVTDPVGNVTEYLYDANLQQVQITVGAQLAAALRRVLKFSYDEENQLVSQADALGFVTRRAVDAPGNVVSVTDANGNATRFDYDRNNRLVKETNALLGTVLHKFDANGNEVETTDEKGNVTRFSFDKDNNQVMVSDANGIETVFTYDSRHNQTSIAIGVQAALDANGRPVISDASQGQVTTFVYDEFNQIVSSTDGVGNALVGSDASVYQQLRTQLGFAALVANLSAADRTALLNRFTERFAYDRVGNLVRSVDHLGRITALEYDALNRLQKRTEAQGLAALERVTSLRYDGNGNVVRSVDGLGRATTSAYNAANRLTGVTDPLGVTTRIDYDNVGNIVASTEAFGTTLARRSEYIYDLNDRLIRERDPGAHEIAYLYDAVGNRTRVTDARGGATQTFYDALNRNVRIIDARSFETRYEYDGVGNRITLIDPRGGITRFEFDPGNRLVKTTDAESRVTQLAYDPLGNVITQTTAFGTPQAEVTTFVYDAEGNLRSFTDAEGKTETRTYDDVYNYTATTDRNGNTTRYGFDALNRQLTITDPLGGVITYTYDLADNKLTETDALGRSRSFTYDADDRVITETDAIATVTRYAYDALDNQVSITRADGTAQAATTTFTYDGDDRLTAQTDALGKITRYEYDANHNVTRIVDANDHATAYEYDANNQVTRIADALGNATRFAYDGNRNRTQVIDARGNTTTTYYNADNEVVLTIDAKGNASARSYDANGNIVSETLFMTPVPLPVTPAVRPTPTASARDQTTTYEYDKLNRVTKRTDPLGGTQLVTYDAVDNRLTETDERGQTTSYEYDDNDRRTKTTDANGGVSTATYDAVGNRLTETDANGHTTSADYDANNRLIGSTNALGDKTEFAYDAVGNQLTQKDPLGGIVANQYDLLDRVTQTTDERGIKTTYEYDAVGNNIAETAALGTADESKKTFAYDEVDRLKSETDALNQTTTYGYDAVGNRTSEREPNGQTTTIAFDALDRIETVTDAAGKSVANVYDAAGNVVREVDANNRVRVDYYDKNNRLILTIDPAGFAESFTYDAAGNLLTNTRHATKVTLPVDPNVLPTVAANAADKKTSYTYDDLDRIATITDGEGFVTSLEYDNVGNQTEQRQQVDKTDPSKDEVKRQYYDELDRLVATVSGEGHLSTVGYDKNGNVTERTDHDKKYTPPANGTPPTPDADDPGRKVVAEYDEKGRLVKEKDPGGLETTHEYDEKGNETKTVEAPGTSEERKKEAKYDKTDRIVESTDELGIVTKYVYDSNGNLTELIEAAGLEEERSTSYTYNNLNQMTSQTDALDNVNEYRYDAFGNLIGQTLAKGTSEERVESFTYDGTNRLATQTNAEGEVTRFEYDGSGNQTSIIVAQGLPEERRIRTEYDRDHRVLAEVDGNGVRTEYRYDGMGNRIEVIQAVGIVGQERHSFYTYDSDGNLLSVTDPLGGITRFEYDATGNQTKITDANNAVTENTYDALGRLLTTITGVGGPRGGVKVENEYDARNNIVKTTQSFADGTDARVTTYTYDKADRQTLVTDGEGFSTRFSYDSFDNQVKIETGLYLLVATDAGYDDTKAARAKTVGLTFTYDELDRLLTTTTDEDGVVEASYNAFGDRLTQTTRAADGSEERTVTLKYDKAGRLTERTTPAGGLDRFTYDEAGNQTEQNTLQSGSGASAIFLLTEFSYDGNGKVVAEIDPLGTRTEHVFDAVGNEIETRFAAEATEQRVLRSVFNLNNDLVAEIDGEAKRTDYVVDNVGNRIKETDALGRVTHLYYDALGQHAGTLDPERYFTAFARDAMGNIVESRIYLNRYTVPADDRTPPAPAAADPARVVTSLFDRVGNPVGQTGADGGVQQFVYSSTRKLIRQTTLGNSVAADVARTSNSTPRVLSFEYDGADRMVKFINVDGVTEDYTYDTANNKTSETITNPNLLAGGRTDPVRTTSFEYDLDNRLTKQIFDPVAGGLQLTEQVGYDAYGNVVKRTDANNNVSTIEYDKVNRQTKVTNPLDGAIEYEYDRLGNRTAVIDPLGNRTDLKYDRNGLVIEELKAAVEVFTVAGGTVPGVRPKTTTQYDAAGNIVQIVDPAGNKTTRWYDGNDNLVAELAGDDALREFTALREYSYNATDDLVTATQYMVRLAVSAHNPLARPTPPAGEARTVTNEYDAGGRLTRVVYPAIEVTTLAGTDTAAPTSSKANVAVSETNRYDRFGNLVESLDRNGNRTVSYYDQRGRVIAAVDAAGFLTESDYDSQDHVVQQRQYDTALTTFAPGTKPTPPGTPAAVVDRVYDIANRLFEETSAAVRLQSGTERIVTRFGYDKVGNETSRTVAFGTVDAATEYTYYDANKRRVATVDDGRVLVQYGYDANNNNTLLKRFFDPVSAGVNLQTATLTSLLADVTADTANDQEKTSVYDALNRQTSQTDLMGPGAADNITVSTRFDSVGNVTSRTDALGNVSRSVHDGLGQIVQSITPDGSSTFFRYDTGGLRVLSWTGDLGGIQAVQASDIAARIGDDLRISYNLSTANNLRSYVVYDTAQRDLPGQYANQTAQQGAGAVSVGIPLASFAAGTTIYFRVVTVDAAGSTAWTEERSVTVPARLTALSVSQPTLSSVAVTVRFSGTVTTPQLLTGPRGGTLGTVTSFVLQGDGSYRATLTPATDIQGFAYQVRWTFGGNTYTTSALPFEAPGAHTAVGQTVTIAVPPGANGTAAPNGQFAVVNGVRVDTAFQSNGILQFNPGLTAAGTVAYHVYYGDLVPTTHTVAISFEDQQSTFVLSDTNQGDPQTSRTQVLRWQTTARETDIVATLSPTEVATIGAGGLHATVKAASDSDVFGGPDITMTAAGGGVFNGTFNLAAGTYDVVVYYIDTSGKQVTVQWLRITVPPPAALPADLTIVDSAAPFDFAGQTASSGGVSDSTFPFNLARAVAVGTPASVNGNSVIITAFERQGSITRVANGTLTVDPGFYSGGLDPNSTGFTVPTAATTRPGAGSAKADGLSAGTYFIETIYNAVGAKIATNEDTGQWRRFGVDANGNAVETRVYGSRADEAANRAPIITFAAFDVRNLEVATFGASVAVDTDGNGSTDATRRAVTRSAFDYAGRLVSRTDPDPGAAARTFQYDGAGNLTREANALGQATTIFYDRRGRETRRTDARGNNTDQTWDAAGRMTSETDGAGVTHTYTHDAFDRVIRITDELNHSSTFGYDQHDRLVRATDANSNATLYTYDKRDDRIWTQDANNHFFGTEYDSMRRVTHTYSFQGKNPTSLADAIDAVGSTANPANAALVDSETTYDIYGNKASEIDPEGRARYFSYGGFGRLISQTDEGGRVATFGYDRFGRLIEQKNASSGQNVTRAYDDAGRMTSVTDSATGGTTAYTYDAGGNRRHETVTAPDFAGTSGTARNVTYSYNGAGELTKWSDSVTGKELSYTYDLAGNLSTVTGSESTDHRHTYDGGNRLLKITQGASTVLTEYTYDVAGNRKTYSDGTTTYTYTYDAADRVSQATQGSGAKSTWLYDAVGNIKTYQEFGTDGTTVVFTQSYTYSENNRTLTSATKDDRPDGTDDDFNTSTANTLDKSGRLIKEVLTDIKNESKTTEFQHAYTADGRETTVTVIGGTSETSGSSSSTYDANDRLIRLDLGQNDNQESAEYKRFIHNSDGQILRRFHDDGEEDTAQTTTTQYLYALGNPVGETGNDTTGATVTVLDREGYDLMQQIGEKFPTASVTDYEVKSGDTLRSIAMQIYGNPSLWFVIADANGLTGDERLTAGTVLKIPNTVELGRLTSETHAVYSESEIVGSRLPNLKAPPPDDSAKCAAIGAIIGVILLAIVGVILSIVTIGIAAPAAAAAVGAAAGAAAGIIAGVLVGAAIGAVIAFSISALSQLILVGAGLQKEFDWTQVLADTAVGFISGGVAGLGELISAGILVGRIAKIAVTVASVALEATGETLRQVIVNPDHRPDNPLSIVLAGVGAGFGAAATIATRAAKLQSASKVAGAVERSGLLDKSLAVGGKFRNTIRKLQDGTKIVKIVQKDGTVVFKQVTRLSAAAKGAPVVSKTLDIVRDVPVKKLFGISKLSYTASEALAPVRTLATIAADVQAVRQLSTAQRAQSVLVDAFGKTIGGGLFKAGNAIPSAASKLVSKVAPYAKAASAAISKVTGKIGTAVSGAARGAATVIGGATGKVGAAIAGAARAVATTLKSAAQTAASAVGRLGRNIGSGLAKLGGVLAKPFKAAAQGLVRTALGVNSAGKIRALRYLAIGTLAPVVAIGKVGSLAVQGVSKVASVVAGGAARFGRAAGTAIAKFGSAVVGGFQKVASVVGKVANGAAQKASSAVTAVGKKLEPVGLALGNVGIFFGKIGRAGGRFVKDIIIDTLDPIALPATIIASGVGSGRIITRNEGDPDKRRALYFRSDVRRNREESERTGVAVVTLGASRPAYGSQGPAGGIGKALFGVLSGERPYRPAYRVPTWENNAAATTTGVYSGFAVDRAINLRAINALNLIRLGRVAALDQATRDAYASTVIGRVSTNKDDVPIALLGSIVPNASPVFAG